MNRTNKITQEEINQLLDTAETEEYVFFGKSLVVAYRFLDRGNFVIIGVGSCVDPANFDIEVGRRVARRIAENQLWQFEGYLLQRQLPPV